MQRSTRTLGILGGMGPYATLAFYRNILDLTPAVKDWDHLRVVIDSNPHIPSRSRHHLYHEPSPVPGMIDSCRRLAAFPVDGIAIPCNSASCFLNEVQAAVGVPILNIMEITVRALTLRLPAAMNIAVLGSVITHERRVYEPYLRSAGKAYCAHDPEVQRDTEGLIEALKLNATPDALVPSFRSIVQRLRDRCLADAVILGCTELGCFFGGDGVLPLVDSNQELARAAVVWAKEP